MVINSPPSPPKPSVASLKDRRSSLRHLRSLDSPSLPSNRNIHSELSATFGGPLSDSKWSPSKSSIGSPGSSPGKSGFSVFPGVSKRSQVPPMSPGSPTRLKTPRGLKPILVPKPESGLLYLFSKQEREAAYMCFRNILPFSEEDPELDLKLSHGSTAGSAAAGATKGAFKEFNFAKSQTRVKSRLQKVSRSHCTENLDPGFSSGTWQGSPTWGMTTTGKSKGLTAMKASPMQMAPPPSPEAAAAGKKEEEDDSFSFQVATSDRKLDLDLLSQRLSNLALQTDDCSV